MNFERLLDGIISISDSIRFVFVTNAQGKIVHSKVSTNSFLLDSNQASVLGVDMQVLRQLLKLYDEIIGANTAVHLVRDKVHVLIYYVGQWTILVGCDSEIDRHKLTDISLETESLVNKALK